MRVSPLGDGWGGSSRAHSAQRPTIGKWEKRASKPNSFLICERTASMSSGATACTLLHESQTRYSRSRTPVRP